MLKRNLLKPKQTQVPPLTPWPLQAFCLFLWAQLRGGHAGNRGQRFIQTWINKACVYFCGGGQDPGKSSSHILCVEKGAVTLSSGRDVGSALGKLECKSIVQGAS